MKRIAVAAAVFVVFGSNAALQKLTGSAPSKVLIRGRRRQLGGARAPIVLLTCT